MKKSHIFAAILTISISPMAIAQNAPPPPDAPSMPDAPPATEAPPAADQPPMTEPPPQPAPEPMPAPPPPSEPIMQPSAAPAPTSAMDKDYPVCNKTVTDNCRNANEGGSKAKKKRK